MRVLFILVLSSILFLGNCYTQFNFEYNSNIDVIKNASSIDNAWSGGLNYAQFSDFDYDYDGDLDLFVFDRSSNNVRVFSQESNGGAHYELVHNAQSNFPDDLRYRATMIDYDNDGKKDLFTYGIGGLKVFRNIGNATSGIQWELYQDIVYSDYPNITTNLYVSSTDIPAIIDVDKDGDIDVLTFHIGGANIEYHQNQSMELYGIPDSLTFVLKNECWGKFSENASTNFILLNDPNVPCVGGSINNPETPEFNNEEKGYEKHAGSTVMALDYDNNGVMDLVIGDVAHTNLSLLINGGSTVNSDSPMISVDYAFPSNTTPSYTQLFPATFYVDVDFDLVKDLIVCPNAKNISFNEKSVQFYKNIGTNELPNFIFTNDDFLQRNMIEHGSGSVPVLFDFDQDGLDDLMVANFYRYKPVLDKESTIAYYKNTGDISNPQFTLIDDDVFNFTSQSYGLRLIPTYGDVDDDGDEDMFIGRDDGTLLYFENTTTGGNATFSAPILNYQDDLGTIITTNGYCHPQLFDLDKDGLLDLILGKKTGELHYYRNIGTVNTPSFELTNTQLGNVDVSTDVPDGYPAPHFFTVENRTVLFVGSVNGKLIYYDSIDNHIALGEDFTLISDQYLGLDAQAYSSFCVKDINNDGNLNLFMGQDLGGLFHFEANPSGSSFLSEIESTHPVDVYPNPANTQITISSENSTWFEMTNSQGKMIVSREINSNMINIDVSSFPSGIYFLKVSFEDAVVVKKVIIE